MKTELVDEVVLVAMVEAVVSLAVQLVEVE